MKVAAVITAKAKFEEISKVADWQDGQKWSLGMLWAKHYLAIAEGERDSVAKHMRLAQEELDRRQEEVMAKIANRDKYSA